ncbi:MAG: 2-oxoacid:acceptor oxidoreductase family protein [Dehalococcoidia bacterium]|nr:2-oxoacid:acceptor oxidoreductase family protein [Dehalococcoidia bacterium]
MNNPIIEIRWHGRGGQGAVTAARIIAQAAYLKGYRGVTAAPSFGAERRGVPVSASTRISREPIKILSQVVEPDVVVVLDHTLLAYDEVTEGLKPGGWLIVNSSRLPQDIGFNGRFSTATTDATSICRELGLMLAGLTLVNIAILGAFIRVTGLVDVESVTRVLKGRFSGNDLEMNLTAIKRTFDITRVNDEG